MESENPASLPMSLSACPMRPAPTMVHAQSLLTAAILRPCPAETAPPPRSWYAARDTLAGAGTISLRMRIRPRACECTCVKTQLLSRAAPSANRLMSATRARRLRSPQTRDHTLHVQKYRAGVITKPLENCGRHSRQLGQAPENQRAKQGAGDTHSAQLSASSPGAGPGRPRA